MAPVADVSPLAEGRHFLYTIIIRAQKNVTWTECSFCRRAFLHLSSMLRIAFPTQQNYNANADYCERPWSKAWETCTSCKYASPLAPFFPAELSLVRTEVALRKAVSQSYCEAHNAVIVQVNPLCVAVCDGPSVLSYLCVWVRELRGDI